MSTLYLFRGLPGSGKSTEAKKLGCLVVEADQFFISNGVYVFNPQLLRSAHDWCFATAVMAMERRVDVAVANTFSRYWEMKNYIEFARKNNITVRVKTCTGQFQNIHNVPNETIEAMRARWEELPHL